MYTTSFRRAIMGIVFGSIVGGLILAILDTIENVNLVILTDKIIFLLTRRLLRQFFGL